MNDLQQIFEDEASERSVTIEGVCDPSQRRPLPAVRARGCIETWLAGYRQHEIAAFLNRDRTTVSYYVKRGRDLRREQAANAMTASEQAAGLILADDDTQ